MSLNAKYNQRGFMMPMLIVLFGASTMILLAIMQYVTTVTTFTNDVIYRQVALSSARSALDYGKEQFDGNQNFDSLVNPANDDNNNNNIVDTLEEKTLLTNSKYRVTYQIEIIPNSTSPDGRSKKVKGIGKVYLPPSSKQAKFTRIINGEIVRSQIVAHDPSDFSPLAWYDASCNAINIDDGVTIPNPDTDCANDTVLTSGASSATGNPISIREELPSGAHCGGEPNAGSASDMIISFSKNSECGLQQQNVGLVFNFKNTLPKGAVITHAFFQFTSAAKDSSNADFIIYGIDANNTPSFTNGGNGQLSTAPLTNGDHDTNNSTNGFVNWSPGPWTGANQSGKHQRTDNLKDLVQEIINRPGWQPSADGTTGNIGFIVKYNDGPGARRAKRAPLTLNITYQGHAAAATNDRVTVWRDRSGNGHHMTAISDAARPTKSTIAMNSTGLMLHGKPMVSFTTTSGMSTSVPVTSERNSNAYTAIALMRIRNGTEQNTGHGAIASFWGGGMTNNERLAPFWRHPVPIHSWDTNPSTGQVYTDSNYICIARNTVEKICKWDSLNGANAFWKKYSSRESILERNALFRVNGAGSVYGQSQQVANVRLQAPYTIALGADAQYLTPRSEVEIAEIILYDRAITCPQIESVEEYLAQKWGTSELGVPSQTLYDSQGCAENNIPAY